MEHSARLAQRSPILRLLRGEPLRTPALQSILDASGLPSETRQLVGDIVRRAGGTRAERADMASELVAHFVDAQRSGTEDAQARAAFGDPRVAAKLMRRAVRRKRGLIWQSWWWASRGFAALIGLCFVGYGILAIRFYGMGPTISIDSLAKIQALAPAGDPGEQAWPLIRSAMANLKEYRSGAWTKAGEWPEEVGPIECEDPTSRAWIEAGTALASHADDLALLRKAGRKPTLGVEYGRFSDQDEDFFGRALEWNGPEGSVWSGAVFRLLLPYLSECRSAGRWLACDARHAAHGNDGARAVDDIEAIVGLAGQLRRPFLIDQLVAHAVLNLGFATTQSLLATAADSFSEADLARLASLFESVAVDDWSVSFEGERIGFEDMLQRAYSDDGNGDGHLLGSTLDAAESFKTMVDGTVGSSVAQAIVGPAVSTAAPSRRTMLERFDRTIVDAEALTARPPWEWTAAEWARIAVPPRRTGADLFALLGLDSLLAVPMSPAAISIPPATRQRLDTTRFVVAVVRYHAATGRWPDSTDDLIPSFLPAPPRDLYDGKALRYAVREASPLVWSIGPDRVDDQLQTLVPSTWNGVGGWQPPLQSYDGKSPYPKGDVILWPPSPRTDAPPGQAVLVPG